MTHSNASGRRQLIVGHRLLGPRGRTVDPFEDSVGCLLSDATRAFLEWRLELLRGHCPGASPAFVAEYDPEVAHVL